MESVVFFATAAVALASALVAVSHRNPVVNVLALVVTFFCVAVNYALLGANFLAAAQILVYAGAILVLFLFVVMLLNAPAEPTAVEPRPFQRVAGFLLAAAAAIGGLLLVAATHLATNRGPVDGNAIALGRLLVGPYLFAFELISVLLLGALVGALVLVKRKH
ncbi:MAG: NADH-quinone oxidoreductase subunit J [Acidobacteriota bacterium]